MSKQWKWPALICAAVMVAFCSGFVFLYDRAQRETARQQPYILTSAAVEKPFPAVRFIDASGAQLDDKKLRQGKVVLVVVAPGCDACDKEAKFLSGVVGRRNDVSFIGVIPFGEKSNVLKTAESEFPFKVFFDENAVFNQRLGLDRVPIKIYLEDGVVKKTWEGAAMQPEIKDEFIRWLDHV